MRPVLPPRPADQQTDSSVRHERLEREHVDIRDTYYQFRNHIVLAAPLSNILTVTFRPVAFLKMPQITAFAEHKGASPTPGSGSTFAALHVGVDNNGWVLNDDGNFIGAELTVLCTGHVGTVWAHWQAEGQGRW